MDFRMETFLNRYLPPGGTRADAVFNLEAAGGGAGPEGRVVGLIGDKSGSMQGEKILALKHALRVAVEQLGEDVEAFVLAFDEAPVMILPPTRMNASGRRMAHHAIQALEAGGGTIMSSALEAAREIFAGRPNALAQAIMLTDGQNDRNDWFFPNALERCAGVFQVDCRGVGEDWRPAQLREIAGHLLGTVGMIATPDAMAKDFQDTLAAAMRKTVPDVHLRLLMPKKVNLGAIKQVYPTELDLTDKIRSVDDRTVDVPLGAWGEGRQDYFATFSLAPLGLDDQMRLCRPSLVRGDPTTGNVVVLIEGGDVTVTWTEDTGLSARIDQQVAHYTGQAEKALAIQEGVEALERGDKATATLRLGRAWELAEESGDVETTRRLREVVEPEAGGTVRLRREAGKVAIMDLDVASVRTVRAKRDDRGEDEKARALQDGLAALQRGDEATATLRLGRAWELAERSGDEATMQHLREVIEPEAGGRVRLRHDDSPVAVTNLDVASVRTVRTKRD